MAPDNKDRLGQRLREKERAEEERFIAERDREALRKLREKSAPAPAGTATCPRCGAGLTTVTLHGVAVDECPAGHGMWLDRNELETIASRERDSWLAKLFALPHPSR